MGELVEGRNLLAADLGGTSDPFAELIIGEKTPKKGSATQFSGVIEKTLAPRWQEVFIFKCSRTDILTINIYDKDKIEIAPEFLGRLQLPLDSLVMDKFVEQWVPLQMVDTGEILLRITALDFGLPSDEEQRPIEPLEVSKYNSVGLIGGLGDIGMKGIKGVTNLGEMGLKGVAGVGEM